MDVLKRFATLHEKNRALRLYALIDGLAYEELMGERLQATPGVNRALFEGTQDAPLAHAGPWLAQIDQVSMAQVSAWLALEAAKPSLSWLITSMDMEGLAQVLQLRMDMRLPTGQTALLRIADPRVLGNLFAVMTQEQKATFFDLIEEWHFLQHGQRVWTGRPHA